MDDDKSRSQKKRESTALQRTGEQLAALSPSAVRNLKLPQELTDALVEYHGIKTHEGRRRYMQYIGRLMRELDDPNIVLDALAGVAHADSRATARFHQLEVLRESLLDADDARRETALGSALAEYPALDSGKLRHIIDAALSERRKQKPPKSSRELFRYLREVAGE